MIVDTRLLLEVVPAAHEHHRRSFHATVLGRVAKSQFVTGHCGCPKSSASWNTLLKWSTHSITLAWLVYRGASFEIPLYPCGGPRWLGVVCVFFSSYCSIYYDRCINYITRSLSLSLSLSLFLFLSVSVSLILQYAPASGSRSRRTWAPPSQPGFRVTDYWIYQRGSRVWTWWGL